MTSSQGASSRVVANPEPQSGELPPLKPIPLTRRVREALLDALLSGRFEGERLPSESQLSTMLGVSRTTIRGALHDLERAGFVHRRQGIGTLINRSVTPSRLGLHRLVGFAQLISEAGHEPSVEMRHRFDTAFTPPWRERLDLDEGAECLVMEKLFRADGKPAIAIVDAVDPGALARRPEPSAELPPGIFEFFDEYGKQSIQHAVVEIAPHVASPELAERLGVRVGQPCLKLIETHYGDADRPVAVSQLDVNDEYVRFDVVRRVQ